MNERENARSPRVSIGLPVRNGENFLAAALDSLLAQTYRDFEIVLGDNASDDGTEGICREYARRDARIRYIRHAQNLGAADNYNLVFREARGPFFKWAAHDDLTAPTFLERCVRVLEADAGVVLCFPRTRYIDELGNEQRVSDGELSIRAADPAARVRRLLRLEIQGDDVFMAVFGVVRRDCLRRTGLIGSYPASDQVLMLELALLGEFHEVREPLFVRRMHPLVSTTKHRTPHGQARWFDPSSVPRIVMPYWRLWWEHVGVIRRSSLSFGQRLGCYARIHRRFLGRYPALLGEMKKAVFQTFGRR